MYTTQQTQMAFPSPTKLFTPGVTTILTLLIAGVLLSTFAPGFTTYFLAVSARNVLHGRIWQLVTYPFVSGSPVNLIFSGLMVLFVGSTIEREWKTASFLLLWLVISAACGLLWVIVNLLTGNDFIGMGASGCTYGLIATMGLLFRGKRFFMFFATVEARYLVLFLIAIGILMNITTPINLVWISGALVAYAYIKLRWSIASKSSRDVSSVEQRRANGFVDID
ncbi:MAG: rhomboid family intramembrane serine protease [Planctomycetota bacterium]|jgi:membrane associated rhomboid family serine protease